LVGSVLVAREKLAFVGADADAFHTAASKGVVSSLGKNVLDPLVTESVPYLPRRNVKMTAFLHISFRPCANLAHPTRDSAKHATNPFLAALDVVDIAVVVSYHEGSSDPVDVVALVGIAAALPPVVVSSLDCRPPRSFDTVIVAKRQLPTVTFPLARLQQG
jgi:hypothetical protein